VSNIESYWPFEELNPQNTIKTLNGPLVLAYEADNPHYFKEAETLAGLGRSHGKQVALLALNVSDERTLLSALRKDYFEQIDITMAPKIKVAQTFLSVPILTSPKNTAQTGFEAASRQSAMSVLPCSSP